jgi:hypothetical protein
MITTNPILAANLVPEQSRITCLPSHFGKYMLITEGTIYSIMGELCNDYTGGYWDFFELTNGGFFMAPKVSPETQFNIQCDGNGYDGHMSAEAAGITVTLFAMSRLSFRYQADTFADHFHWLRDFVSDHPEASEIFAAID